MANTLEFQWSNPWQAVEDGALLAKELRRELSNGHCLYGRTVVAIGRRCDCDEVLFQLVDGPPEYAIVHLTWREEKGPEFPFTWLFENVTTLFERIREDSQLWQEQASD